MTDYNDGNWWGWNGGECPVHPESEVEAVYRSIVSRPYNADTRPAKEWDWSAVGSNIIAFRVVKPYREPREYEAWGVIRNDRLQVSFASIIDAEVWVKNHGGRVIKLTGRDDDRA